MKLKKLVTVLVAVLALGVVAVSSASAAAVTEDVQWYTGPTSPGTLLSGEETISASGSVELISEVGTTELILKATGLECVSCSIFNEEGKAESKGHLKETGVTVVKPSQCAVESKDGVVGQITTEPLKLTPNYMIGSTDYVRFEPVSGTVIDTFKLIKGSASCPIAGTYSTTGTLFAQSNNATNTFAVNQSIVLSGEINKTAGGEVLLGAKLARVNGTASFILAGAKSGTGFATH